MKDFDFTTTDWVGNSVKQDSNRLYLKPIPKVLIETNHDILLEMLRSDTRITYKYIIIFTCFVLHI